MEMTLVKSLHSTIKDSTAFVVLWELCTGFLLPQRKLVPKDVKQELGINNIHLQVKSFN
jgi:hypothetical protein